VITQGNHFLSPSVHTPSRTPSETGTHPIFASYSHHLQLLAQKTAVLPEISSSSAFFKRQEARYVNAENLGAKEEEEEKNDRLIITHQGSAWPEFGVALRI
jgi:hypothetical protein